jgi:hypothetical protein
MPMLSSIIILSGVIICGWFASASIELLLELDSADSSH